MSSASWQSPDELAQQWWANQRTERPEWTPIDEFLAGPTQPGDLDRLDLVRALVAAADGREELVRVGAGPLEELIVRQGTALVDRIEQDARQDAAFRVVLSGVWLGGEVPTAIRLRLVRFGVTDLSRTGE